MWGTVRGGRGWGPSPFKYEVSEVYGLVSPEAYMSVLKVEVELLILSLPP